jgi:uncharacterized protein (DUF362 family)/Pyruvate/2-oxoacid:ferredoxin oxidoreductase delta subunit
MSKVIFKKSTYHYDTLRPNIFDMLDAIGSDLFQGNPRVLIKPNFLSPAKPERAILTHPLVIRAVTEYVLSKGGQPQISDSPALGSFEKLLKEGGYDRAFKGLEVSLKALEESVKVDIGEPFGQIEIARDVMEADMVINLAKLKTHSQMLLTLGVKNLFGCIVGFRKPEWHLRAGVDRDVFARLLVQIYNAVKPAVTIVDGILALEGQGPGKSGTPRRLGILVGSRDGVEVDRAICRMLGIEPNLLLTNKVASEMGMFSNQVLINGDFHIIYDFKLPVLGPLTFGPRLFQKVMRKHLIQRPVVDDSLCTRCAECRQYCPAKAISFKRGKMNFDYDSCIRCYCCAEICPYGAVTAAETLPGKIMRRLSSFR